MNKDYLNEKSLDPDDWDAFNKLLYKVSDDLVEYLKNVGERPVWKSLPKESKKLFDESLPRTGTEYAKVYD